MKRTWTHVRVTDPVRIAELSDVWPTSWPNAIDLYVLHREDLSDLEEPKRAIVQEIRETIPAGVLETKPHNGDGTVLIWPGYDGVVQAYVYTGGKWHREKTA